MARLFADEQFPQPAVDRLRALGHDVITCQEAGISDRRVSDPRVLALATQLDRAVLTLNRWDFVGLHNRSPDHGGIIVCTFDTDFDALADRIGHVLKGLSDLRGRLIRVNLPLR